MSPQVKRPAKRRPDSERVSKARSGSDAAPDPWYSDGLRFACTGCGACCKGEGYVWVDEQEIERLAAFLGLGADDFGRRYLRQVGRRLSLVDGKDLACVFWDDGCTVYEARPGQCRTFPFWRENLASKAAWNLTAEQSPGVGHGRLYALGEIDRLLDGVGAASEQQTEKTQKTQAALERREGDIP